ncbi:hypothetical protein GCM10018781_50980 [Kitasatospora indigofera]|uniref:Uncharacterized protein n=1 Tax=Kitasatospora indigofera TaxID=67307 RepID=A0A919G4G5_9ACTN|nr:hypothetical protein GCM10018781_50980 [Kitasatospora indigofera]
MGFLSGDVVEVDDGVVVDGAPRGTARWTARRRVPDDAVRWAAPCGPGRGGDEGQGRSGQGRSGAAAAGGGRFSP